MRFSFCRTGFHVPAEFLPHGRKHLLRKRVLLPRAEAHVQRRRQHFRRNGFFDCRLDRPTPFAGILHITLIFGERRIFGQAPWRLDPAATN
jgi:hypothetical protein